MDKTLEQEIRQILTETCRGEIHAAMASILTLIAAARPAGINTPDMPGQFEGDIWFGDPVKRNLGTHRWENGEWVLLPSELESVLELLAVRTAQRDAALSAARQAVVSDEVVEAMCEAYEAEFGRTYLKGRAARIAAMRVALALLPGGVVPEGYVLVPREPTEAMLEALADAIDPISAELWDRETASVAFNHANKMGRSRALVKADTGYRAMLSASPKGSSRSQPSRTPCDLWRDISTAPKDGKPILLGWLELGWVGEGRFIEDAGWFEAGAHPTDHTDGEVWPDLWMSMPELPLRVAGPCVLHPHSDEKDAGENDQSREEQNPSASPKEVR